MAVICFVKALLAYILYVYVRYNALASRQAFCANARNCNKKMQSVAILCFLPIFVSAGKPPLPAQTIDLYLKIAVWNNLIVSLAHHFSIAFSSYSQD